MPGDGASGTATVPATALNTPAPSVYPQHPPFYAMGQAEAPAGVGGVVRHQPPAHRHGERLERHDGSKPRRGFFSGLFSGRLERSPKKDKRERRRADDVEKFRERVLQAEALIRQFKKLSRTTEREPSEQLRQDRLYVQEQLATLSRALKEEAKELKLLPPTPPRRQVRQSYNSSPSTLSTEDATSDDVSIYTESQSSPSVSATSTSITEDTVTSRGYSGRRTNHRSHHSSRRPAPHFRW
eukprot:TRINITY_DN31835_c0_g1_i1.p1 TRINITY_DN31835_c0_g1~~TRINITY_DN31835_c0_g1_i1.p1  ORF type:complete len:274 (+),score=67.28 TRINITY_DN31835_c0_g1_i1:103-822(+)